MLGIEAADPRPDVFSGEAGATKGVEHLIGQAKERRPIDLYSMKEKESPAML
jgi:hypothetical protein